VVAKGKVVALDFDGVLHSYLTRSERPVDAPVPGAHALVSGLQERGASLVVFTARERLEHVEAWLRQHGFPALKVVNVKPRASLYVDDRGLRYDGNPKTVLDFVDADPEMRPWHYRRPITPERAAALRRRKR
jgi:hypothetical protein